jgi:hypothetical protein
VPSPEEVIITLMTWPSLLAAIMITESVDMVSLVVQPWAGSSLR